MKFNSEDNITWYELSPSLQELFKSLQSQITKEAQERIAADNQLRTDLNKEIADRIAADNQLRADLNKETQERIAADNKLRTDLNKETQERIAADNKLRTDLNKETADRIAADQTLSNSINNLRTDLTNETNRAKNAEKALSDRIDGLDTRVKKIEDDQKYNSITNPPTPVANQEKGYQQVGITLFHYGHIKNVYYDESHYEHITFDPPFPNKCISVVATCNQDQYIGGMRTVYVVNFDKNGADLLPGFKDQEITANINWLAIGM